MTYNISGKTRGIPTSGIVSIDINNIKRRKARREKFNIVKNTSILILATALSIGSAKAFANLKNNDVNLNMTSSIAYTNYSKHDIDSMNFYDRCQLYHDYIIYIASNAEEITYNSMMAEDLKAQYQNQNNYLKYLYDAQGLLDEFTMQKSALDEQSQQNIMSKILSKYQEALNIINRLYNGKYTLYDEAAVDCVIDQGKHL